MATQTNSLTYSAISNPGHQQQSQVDFSSLRLNAYLSVAWQLLTHASISGCARSDLQAMCFELIFQVLQFLTAEIAQTVLLSTVLHRRVFRCTFVIHYAKQCFVICFHYVYKATMDSAMFNEILGQGTSLICTFSHVIFTTIVFDKSMYFNSKRPPLAWESMRDLYILFNLQAFNNENNKKKL